MKYYLLNGELGAISHFTVAYSVTRPMNGSKAAGYTDLAVLIL